MSEEDGRKIRFWAFRRWGSCMNKCMNSVIAVEAFGLNNRQEMALDSFEMASCFND